jgi:hypothetical protein
LATERALRADDRANMAAGRRDARGERATHDEDRDARQDRVDAAVAVIWSDGELRHDDGAAYHKQHRERGQPARPAVHDPAKGERPHRRQRKPLRAPGRATRGA